MSEIKTKLRYYTPAVVLTVIGGSLILVGGIISLGWTSMWTYMDYNVMDGDMMHGMMGERMSWMMGNAFSYNIMNSFAVAGIASGLIVLISGIMIHQRPQDSQTWGIIALVFSITGLLGMGGFIIGTILGTLGGILTIFLKR